ncbi:MAG: type VII secretion protein EccB [Pseudonocardiaceae bacterium]
MATTRDKAEAYAYENRRQVTSLIRGADEALDDPRRRLTRAMAGGIAVGVLISAVFGVIGLLGGGSGPGLPDSGAVVVAGSGDTYVVLDGVVHEALNLSSAMLVGGGPPTEVRAETLVGKPRGLPIGIPGAPDALPQAQRLTNDPWTVCAVPDGSVEGTAPASLYVGLPEPGGELTNADAVLLRSPNGQLWLVIEGRRRALPGQTLEQLRLPRAEPIPLPSGIIATIPEGPEMLVEDLPSVEPRIRRLQRDQPLCVRTRPGASPGDAPWRVSLHTPEALPHPVGIISLRDDRGGLIGPLEAVLIPSGSGALVRSSTSAGKDGAYTLITDSGQRYLIVSAKAVSRLGYHPDEALTMPSPFVDLLRRGPDLDPRKAAVIRRGPTG